MPLVVFIIEVLLFGYLEKRIFGTIFTPATLLGVPYLVVVLIVRFWGPELGYFPLYMPSIWVWVIGYFIFCSSGMLLSVYGIGKMDRVKGPLHQLSINVESEGRLLRIVAYVCLTAMYFNLYRTLRSFHFEYSEEFINALGHGIWAHAYFLITIPVVFFIATSPTKPKSILNLIIILLWLVYAFFYNAKIWIVYPVISGIVGRIMFFKIKLRPLHIALVVGFGILVFYLSYSLIFGYWAPWWFIKQHFFKYVNSGILGLSEHMKNGMDIGISFKLLFLPLVNVWNVISGAEVKSAVSDLLIQTGPEQTSNIKTFFGSIYIFGGTIGGGVTVIVWSFITYLILILSIRLRQMMFAILYLFYGTTLIFGWFDIIFNSLTMYEVLVFALAYLVLDAINSNKGKVYIYDV